MPTRNTTSPKAIAAREKARQALELRKAGLSYAAIATRIGVSKSRACQYVKNALKDLLHEPAESLRLMEAERLDALLLGQWQAARKGNATAVDRVLKIMERRAKLLGLDSAHSNIQLTGADGGPVQVNAPVIFIPQESED